MGCAAQSCREYVCLPVDIVCRYDDRFRVAGTRLRENLFAECDDLVVLCERNLKPVDRCQVLLDAASQRCGECFLFGCDDVALKRVDLALTVRDSPVPWAPLKLNSRKPIAVEAIAKWIEAGSSITCSSERRQSWLLLSRSNVVHSIQQVTRSLELLVFGSSAQICCVSCCCDFR